MQLLVMLEAMQGILAGLLVAFLLGIAFATGTLLASNDNLRVEERRAVFGLGLVEQDKLQRDFVLLAPFQQLALEVHFLIRQLVYVDELPHYLPFDEPLAVAVATVKVDGTDEGFECVACEVAVVHVVMFVLADKLVESYLNGQLSKRLPLYYLAAGIGQEAFPLAWEVVKDYLADDGIEHGIAQKFQPFVVEGNAALYIFILIMRD